MYVQFRVVVHGTQIMVSFEKVTGLQVTISLNFH